MQTSTPHRAIKAEHLQLALVARKARPSVRWAAMSNTVATPSCAARLRGDCFAVALPAVLSPMARGNMQQLLERVRSQGAPEVRRTWRTGMRAMRAEFHSYVMTEAQP